MRIFILFTLKLTVAVVIINSKVAVIARYDFSNKSTLIN